MIGIMQLQVLPGLTKRARDPLDHSPGIAQTGKNSKLALISICARNISISDPVIE
jgi:hypothetical protein